MIMINKKIDEKIDENLRLAAKNYGSILMSDDIWRQTFPNYNTYIVYRIFGTICYVGNITIAPLGCIRVSDNKFFGGPWSEPIKLQDFHKYHAMKAFW
jgi:hypothetical protein